MHSDLFGTPFSEEEYARTDYRHSSEIDGDILVADSYRKHPKHMWGVIQRTRVIFIVSLLLFFGLVTKLYYIQIVRGAEFLGAAEGNRIRKVTVIPPRGTIIDAQGKRIAYNVPNFALYAVPYDLPETQEEEEQIFAEIADVLDMETFDVALPLARIPRSSFSAVEITRDITQEQAIKLEQRSQQWKGVYISPIEQRAYAETFPLSHIIGYTGKMNDTEYTEKKDEGYLFSEHIGKIGIEQMYQSALRGIPGERLVEVDSFGKTNTVMSEVPALPGKNVYLHIDTQLQDFIWDLMIKTTADFDAPGGAVVVEDPRNGALKALVSFPGYNNQAFVTGIDSASYSALLQDPHKPLFNRAITGEYPSGSTFKIVVGAAALEEGLITKSTSLLSTGGIRVNAYYFPDWKAGGHGQTNIIHALADSVNTFFYAVGGGYEHIDGLGVEKITQYGKTFGLAEKTDVDLPAERPGFLPSKSWKEKAKGERWFLGDTYHLAIGQGDILVTPLQIASMTSVVANGGTIYAPRIVDRIGRSYEQAEPFVGTVQHTDVADPSTLRTIAEGLRAAVTYGSARSLATLPVHATGKTGTAEFSETKKPHAWFTGYAPYESPELVVTVLVEEGEGGSLAATPIAKKIFEWYFGSEQDKAFLQAQARDAVADIEG